MKNTNLLIFVSIWCLVIFLTPISKNIFGENHFHSASFYFFGKICHQIENRSFSIFGETFPVCSRCFSIYFSFLIGLMFFKKIKISKNLILIFTFLPIFIDFILEFFGLFNSSFFSRTITGVFTGFGLSVLIGNDLNEFVNNFFTRKGIV